MITRAVCRVLVGREEELSSLEDALLAACRSEGSVVVLAGDAGMGKSRLCTELAARAEKIGAAVMEGSCSEAELALPYLPFLEAIGNHLAVADTESLRKRLGVHGRELGRLFPQLGAEAGFAEGHETPDARLRLFEAMLSLLGVVSEEHGLLLIVEDLHWADASTRELLDYLTRRLRNRRILVLATYRRDEMHRKHPLLPTVQGWQRSRLARIVELEPLPPDGVARMVSSIFDNTNVGAEFRDFLHARSEGNPFVLEEMLKAAIDRGDIYREDADWQRKPIAELRLPETVRDTILLRVERLDPNQAEILRCGAVLGRSFDYQTLIALSEQDRGAVESALQTAVQQQLLEEEIGSRGRYRFRHALTQEAIYDDLSAPTRERLHSAAADVLAATSLAPAVEIAFHLRAANRWQEAIAVTLDAAGAAEAGRGYDEAAALYSVLLPVVTTGVERARLLCRLGEAYWRASRPVKAVEPLEEGIRLLELGGHLTEAAHHRLTLGRCQWERSEPKSARREYELALQGLEPAGPTTDLALAYVRLAGLHVFDVDGIGGQRFAELARQTADAAGADDMRIWSLNFLGIALAYQGDYPGGIEFVEQSAREALASGLQDIAGNALHNLVTLYLDNLQPDRLPEVIDRLGAIEIERWRDHSRLFARLVWGHQTGDLGAALEATREMLARAEQMDSPDRKRTARLGLGVCLVELDRLDEARQYLVRPSADAEAQDSTADAWLWLRFHLAAGDLAGALSGAEFIMHEAALNDEGNEAAVEVFIAAGREADAEVTVARLETAASPVARLAGKLARGRLLLARGEAVAARPLVEEAAAEFGRAGLVLRAGRGRLLLAQAHLECGSVDSAVAELRGLFELARMRGLTLLEREAREALAELGVIVGDGPGTGTVSVAKPTELGERLVTVLFADVRGYTAMSAELSPQEMVDKISAFQRWAAHEVERHFGVVDKFAGDAVMATFNVSGTTVDHASHALAVALALRDKASLLGLPIGVGIATGAAVVGTLKSGANLSVVGQTTNLASRLQAQAAAGEVLLSEETHRRLPAESDGSQEELRLKGFAQPVIAYRLHPRANAPMD